MTAKGWQGSLGLPRVLTVNYLEGVTDSSATEKGYWDSTQASDGTYTIKVLPQSSYLTLDPRTGPPSRALKTSHNSYRKDFPPSEH
jgi:hypothetical protein